MHCVCKSFGGLIVVRLLLGAFEAAVAPCLLIVTGMWYKREEQPLRIGCWYLGVGVGVVLGALVSYGFQFYEGQTFKSWQIMYLVCGLLTIVLGILIVWLLPDSPMASRLNAAEKVAAIERVRANQTGIENKTWKWHQFRETMLDVKTLLIVITILAGNIPTGATGSFSSLLIKSFGYTSKQAALLNIPSGFIQGIAVILASWAAGRGNARGIAIVCLFLPGILGGGLIAFLPIGSRYTGAQLTGIYLCGIFGPNLSVIYSWAAANYAGNTKKVTINAVILAAYGASNVMGPLTFSGATAPQYIPAKVTIMAALALAVLSTLALRTLYVLENKKRDRVAVEEGEPEHMTDVEFMDLTDQQNRTFRIPKNTLEGLPDELLVKIVYYAVQTNEGVNLGPETMRQDIGRIKREMLRPFARSPKLLAIAQSEFREEDLVYRLQLDLVRLRRIDNSETRVRARPAELRSPVDGLDIFFEDEDGLCWAGLHALRVRKLEVIIPMDTAAIHNVVVASPPDPSRLPRIVGGVTRAFPSLTSLKVRITTFSSGFGGFTTLPGRGRVWFASSRPDEVAAYFEARIRSALHAVEGCQTIRSKEVVLFQESERPSRTWRNGPLGEPFAHLDRSDFDADLSALTWQMMDLPSSCLHF
ncbi:hypothetical protein LTR97_009204 [Elasticomyces elasticus]|uniref:Major facilitator superfamily (MFS) profile domain-containing protein n=1 Tax=Elasticomyces elasticus TaxID=574655 RepID=A0AAN7W036_9PEZI|nr:hypothetical protein LTR97_009204 [Elasticomyces elasticus]